MANADRLYDAIEAGDLPSIAALLDADPGLVEGAGATPPPIHWAIYHDRPESVGALVERGADIERRDQDRDATPAEYAVVFGRLDIVRHLLEAGASPDGLRELATRGAAGELAGYPDVASPERFAEVASLFEER